MGASQIADTIAGGEDWVEYDVGVGKLQESALAAAAGLDSCEQLLGCGFAEQILRCAE